MPTPRLVRQPRRAAVTLAALLLASSAAQAQQAADIATPRVTVERYTLPNGLTVLLSADRSAPVVAVDMWYHVGSKNEKPGRTGFAHLFEHVMFQGSEHVGDDQHLKIIEEAGGNINGSTNTDRTNYYDVVPSSELETALWLEADRMGWLLPVLTQQKLDNQRDVVKNERRQRYENQPFGIEPEVTMANIYSSGHPYSWTTIGSMADLSAASLDDVKQFFRTYYAPNNATLAIVGDFDAAKAKAWVEKYFGAIPRGPEVTRPTVPTTLLVTNKRIVLEDAKARQPQITFAWPTVGQDNPDALVLQGLAATLTRDRTSRLRKLLVYDRQLATAVNAHAGADENAGEFYIYVTPRPNVSLTQIETIVDSVVASVVAAPPTEREAARTKNFAIVGAITGLQSVLNKAEVLLEGQVFFDDPQHFTKELDDYRALTAADIHRVAQKYLTGGHLVLSMVPAGKLDLIARPELPYTNVTPAAPAATSTK
ncbi:MAG TPA: pitrilysin family protein [Gemmatimonadaceae bacterium]|nr:pitrilysin family protein [Gemmatimonadaceae bacterium]